MVCPELAPYSRCINGTNGFACWTYTEWVMKSVKAVIWAQEMHGEYDTITTGGHSGGAPAAASAGYILQTTYGVTVDAYVLQHPGIIFGVNVPGCAIASLYDGIYSHSVAQGIWECNTFFPVGMGSQMYGKIMITCGTMCEATTAENSNWFYVPGSEFSACFNSVTGCVNRSVLPPAGRQQQGLPPYAHWF